MKAVIQKVTKAKVIIKDTVFSEISTGLLILLGIESEDSIEDIEWLTGKIANLRIFDDENKVMNLSLKQVMGEALVVSQFTLYASTKKGNRPSYIKAAKPDIAIPLYEQFIELLEMKLHKKIATGKFGATMQLDFINDGPVTIIIDTKNKV